MSKYLALLLLILVFISSSCKKDEAKEIEKFHKDPASTAAQDSIRINEMQVLASHNSYRKRTYDPIFNYVLNLGSLLPADLDPTEWDYTHPEFDIQFEHNVRSLEIDIYNDPNGGLFYNRQGLDLVGEASVESNIPELQEPGFKVLHIPDLDYETNYYTFKSALQALKNWSKANPNHIPMFIYIEAKASGVADVLPLTGFAETIAYTSSSADALDAELKAVFGNNLDKIITPDEVRGEFPTLNKAIKSNNWPLLKDARGKFLFVISGDEMIDVYTQGKPNLENRAMFVFSSPGKDNAAIILKNDPIANESKIADLVKQGYIVRTRADNGVSSAQGLDYSRSKAAFASGAQIVSTDYYRADLRSDTSSLWTDFEVQIPENKGVARFNPVNATEILESAAEITE